MVVGPDLTHYAVLTRRFFEHEVSACMGSCPSFLGTLNLHDPQRIGVCGPKTSGGLLRSEERSEWINHREPRATSCPASGQAQLNGCGDWMECVEGVSGGKGPQRRTFEKPPASLCIYHLTILSTQELRLRNKSRCQRDMDVTCSGSQRNAKGYAKDSRAPAAFLASKYERTATALRSVNSPETLGTISMHRR
jgi:hypothetical protein